MNKLAAIAVLAFSGMLPIAGAAPLFADNFESGLGNWLAKGGGPASAQAEIVSDPLVAGNSALRFVVLNAGGSIVSTATFSAAATYTIEFDYLGLGPATGGSVVDDYGGFLGIGGLAGDPCNCWLAGTQAAYLPNSAFQPLVHLIDDNQWRHYAITFTPPSGIAAFSGGFRIMIEDFSGSGGIAGDAYFDNISIAAVPEPGTSGLLLGAGGLLWAATRRRRRA
jgi:hypothetical protein